MTDAEPSFKLTPQYRAIIAATAEAIEMDFRMSIDFALEAHKIRERKAKPRVTRKRRPKAQ